MNILKTKLLRHLLALYASVNAHSTFPLTKVFDKRRREQLFQEKGLGWVDKDAEFDLWT